jgi:hypothetical protein
MKKDKKFLIGLLASLGLSSIFLNTTNAQGVETNLKNDKYATFTAEAVFLLSRPDHLNKPSRDNVRTLAEYQDKGQLTDIELKTLLSACGFEDRRLVEAWAIVKKESMGNALAFNGNKSTGDKSYGLFQINMIGDLNADRKEKYNLDYTSQLLNPSINCQVAYIMSDGGKNWGPWKGITSKTREFMYQFPKD